MANPSESMRKFSQRSDRAEMMDDPALQGEELVRNLEEIAQVNRRLGGEKTVLSGLQQILKKKEYTGLLHIADLGCGSGDLPRMMVRWCRKQQVPVKITAVDIHPFILAYAKEQSAGYPEIEYRCADIFSEEFRKEQFDIITMSLFLHHFPDEKAKIIVENAYRQSRMGIVLNDLHRSVPAYYLFKLFTFATGASGITRHDGLVSILRSFRKTDLEKLLAFTGKSRYTIRWKWAFRWQLVGMK